MSMPRGQLSQETRLQIQITKLTNTVQQLRATVKGLKGTLKAKDREIAELKARLEEKEMQRKQLASYLYKEKRVAQDKKPRGKRPGAPAYHRPKPKDEEVTETKTFCLSQCPICSHPFGDVVDTVIKYEEDIDLAPRKIIKKYVIARYWCSSCHEFVKSPHVPPITCIGPNVMGYILYSHYRLRLPQEKIKESLLDLHNFRISKGEIAEKLKEAETLFGKDYDAVIELIKDAKIVYADETGWRMDGENWWLWVFATDKGIRYVLEMSRGKGVAVDALGTNKDRVIVSDGYAAYAKIPGDKQQCWVHLLRVAKQASYLLYHDLVRLYLKLGDALSKPIQERDPSFFEHQLSAISTKSYHESRVKKVQERIKRHHHQLLTCLKYEGVLPENNTAERALRPQVVMRKIFGGSRSPGGAKTHEVNSSVLETLRIQNPNASFFEVVLPLLKKRREERYSKL